MKTNFFQWIAKLNPNGKWIVTAEFTAENALCVSVLLTDKRAEDTKIAMPPMVFRGTPQEIDEGIIPAMMQPVIQTVSLFSNAEAYQKSIEEKKAQLVEKAKAKTDAPKAKTENIADAKKVYEEKMKKVAELESVCKYEQALCELPSTDDYPDRKADIEKVKTELERKSKQLSLL